jgi:3-isopropylmalate/(R)-2-methylmalate dehydratase small subunit
MNGIFIVIAESFARIFRQNMYNCGLIAAELPAPELDALFAEFAGKDTTLEVVDLYPSTSSPVLTEATLVFRAGHNEKRVPFVLKDFDRALVEAGGWVEYAAERY